MGRVSLAVVAIALAGCASQIMGGMVGKDITEVMLSYGPPASRFEMPDGRTAFQWRMSGATVMPTTTTFVGTGNVMTAQTTGGGMMGWTCNYTLFATPNSANSYTITGFQPPSFGCE